MKNHDQFLRIKTLAGRNSHIIAAAMRHNLREDEPGPHIDRSRTNQNRVLHGAETASEAVRHANAMIAATGCKVRSNAIMAIEVLVCLPAGSDVDAMAFFVDALAWANQFFAVPVLSAVAHFDEANPHMHLILLPIVDGKLRGSVVTGDRRRIQAMQGDFSAKVGSRYGLRRKTASRLSNADRSKEATKILDALIANPSLMKGGLIRSMMRDLIATSVEPLSVSMGWPVPESEPMATADTFVKLMTRAMRPARKKSAIGLSKIAIGDFPPSFGRPEKQNSYCSVGDCDFLPVEVPVVGGSNLNF